jgi:hypothetical protein
MSGEKRKTTTRLLRVAAVVALVAQFTAAGCAKPTVDGLRDSFAEQLKANRFVTDFQRNGDELLFSAPDGEGSPAKWRIHIDSSVIEAYRDETRPYKGTVKSSWFANGAAVVPRGRESNLPVELLDSGITQDCWAFWEKSTKRWDW